MKREINKKRRIRPSLLIVLGIILVLTMISQLAFLSIFGTKGKEVAKIRESQKELILENELLEVEISRKQSLIRIREIAENELGMINAGEIEYISESEPLSERSN